MEGFAGGLHITTPSSAFFVREGGPGEGLGQVAAQACFLVNRPQLGDRRTVLEQDKRDVLIMHAVDAVREMARRLRHANGCSFHEIILSDFTAIVKSGGTESAT